MKKTKHKLVHYETQEVLYLDFTFAEWLDVVFSDGSSNYWLIKVGDDIYYDHGIVRKKSWQTAGNWPMVSTAAGLHVDDVEYQMKQDAINGVKTEYDSDGDPILTSKKHRRDYMRSRGIHDRNAGYSDPVQ